MAEDLGHLVTACRHWYFSQKHLTTQPNLNGEYRNYLVNYSVPTANWDYSGPKFIFFGLFSQSELAVYDRPKFNRSWAFRQGTGVNRTKWSHI